MTDTTNIHIAVKGEVAQEDMDKLLAQVQIACDMLGLEFEASLVARLPDVVARRMGIEAAVKRAINDDDRSISRIAADAGVPVPSVHRFMKGESSMNTSSMDKICLNLGLFLGRPVLAKDAVELPEDEEAATPA